MHLQPRSSVLFFKAVFTPAELLAFAGGLAWSSTDCSLPWAASHLQPPHQISPALAGFLQIQVKIQFPAFDKQTLSSQNKTEHSDTIVSQPTGTPAPTLQISPLGCQAGNAISDLYSCIFHQTLQKHIDRVCPCKSVRELRPRSQSWACCRRSHPP